MTTIAENLKIIKDSTADIKQAIIEKGGEVGNLTTYADAIRGIQTGSTSIWTGHVDVEGLKAIGWDDDDIAYFQKHGVNWMAEDDEYHKVSEDNKALYGVLTTDNYKEYKDRIVYLPKFNLDWKDGYSTFEEFQKMVGLPLFDDVKITNLYYTFENCSQLSYMIPIIGDYTRMAATFKDCHSLSYLPPCVTDAKGVTFLRSFEKCYSLKSVYLDAGSISSITSIFASSTSLANVRIKKIANSIAFSSCPNITKSSLLFMIENEAATSPITITLHTYTYARLANDPDIVAALSNHPNVSLASA